ncbi:Uncharacterized protein ImpH/VasB [hydrothermal vent metagenome]|uniref:Uncharacterized protein ImpH/VasB n=1 Tax=hydrothermal vent metagenome TaxID=652676 RepID=A0A3B0YZK8_9ZZZZ
MNLLKLLSDDPYRFGFFEALRQLECLYSNKPRLGESLRACDDSVRLGQEASLKFASSTLASFNNTNNGKPGLQVNFFGVFGPNGPLPLHLTEYARHRLRHAKDPVFIEFMDLFHHRLLSLFYRAWANKEPTVQYDRPQQDRFTMYMGALLGIGMPTALGRDSMPDHTKLHFAAHLGCHTRHTEGLCAILSVFFRLTVRIEEFVGEWLDIPEDDYCYLKNTGSAQLGKTAVIGVRSWQRQHKYRICMGPIDLQDYQRLLPQDSGLKRLADIVKNYTGHEFKWDLNLVLKKENVPTARLGEYTQLGWTAWMKHGEATADRADLIMDVERQLASESRQVKRPVQSYEDKLEPFAWQVDTQSMVH